MGKASKFNEASLRRIDWQLVWVYRRTQQCVVHGGIVVAGSNAVPLQRDHSACDSA